MKNKPYTSINKKYNRSCLLCGKVCNGIGTHIKNAQYWERWLKKTREDSGMTIKKEEIRHLTNN